MKAQLGKRPALPARGGLADGGLGLRSPGAWVRRGAEGEPSKHKPRLLTLLNNDYGAGVTGKGTGN